MFPVGQSQMLTYPLQTLAESHNYQSHLGILLVVYLSTCWLATMVSAAVVIHLATDVVDRQNRLRPLWLADA